MNAILLALRHPCPEALMLEKSRSSPNDLFLDVRNSIAARGGSAVKIRPAAMSIVAACAAKGSTVWWPEIVDILHGDREDGGPDSPVTTIQTLYCAARNLLAEIGIAIRARWGFGIDLIDLHASVRSDGAAE